MANEEVTIQFEGYDDETATYVVLTNNPDIEEIEEIEEITDDDRYIETEEIEFQPDCDEDIDQLLVNGTQTSNIETISTDADVQLVAAPSGSQTREPASRKRKYKDTEVEEWMIKLPVGIIEAIREPLRPYRMEKATKGDIETTKDGVMRRHDGKRWHRLCSVRGCYRVCKKMGKCITHFNNKDVS